MPECEVCHLSVMEVNLFRNAPKGKTPAHWRCEKHLDEKYKPKKSLKTITDKIKEALEEGRRGKK